MSASTFETERENVTHSLFEILRLMYGMDDAVWGDEIERTLVVESVAEDLSGFRALFAEMRQAIRECKSLEDVKMLRATYDSVIRSYVHILHEHTNKSDDTSMRWLADRGFEIAVAAIAQRLLKLLESRL